MPPEIIDRFAKRIAEELAARIAPVEPYLDTDQAASYLACPKRRLYDLVEREAIICHRDGKRLLFRRADLDAYVSAPRDGKQ